MKCISRDVCYLIESLTTLCQATLSSLQSILSWAVVIWFVCFSTAYLQFKFLGQEAQLTLCHTPLLAKHTVSSKYLSENEEASYKSYHLPTCSTGEDPHSSLPPSVFKEFVCLYWAALYNLADFLMVERLISAPAPLSKSKICPFPV